MAMNKKGKHKQAKIKAQVAETAKPKHAIGPAEKAAINYVLDMLAGRK